MERERSIAGKGMFHRISCNARIETRVHRNRHDRVTPSGRLAPLMCRRVSTRLGLAALVALACTAALGQMDARAGRLGETLRRPGGLRVQVATDLGPLCVGPRCSSVVREGAIRLYEARVCGEGPEDRITSTDFRIQTSAQGWRRAATGFVVTSRDLSTSAGPRGGCRIGYLVFPLAVNRRTTRIDLRHGRLHLTWSLGR
ncbi:MAG: hypothetical protein QOE36_241 [Gaiellaceae bacterium]|nr:hypothetical protein [Gaiellaceae bacterium]